MKKIFVLLFLSGAIYHTCAQKSFGDLPVEFRNIAASAFEKVSPATKQWFIDIVKQHPSGAFDTAWARKKLNEKFSYTDMSSTRELFMVMLAYQKMMNKDAREDRKMATQDKQMAITAKDSKLKLDNEKIDQSKKEAEEKERILMEVAYIGMVTGIAQGAMQIGAATTSYSRNNNNATQVNQIKSSTRITPAAIQKIDSSKSRVKNANQTQVQINEQERKAAADDEAKKASEDHKKAMRDAIQKLLDQMGRMKPNM